MRNARAGRAPPLSLVNHFAGLQTLARPMPNVEADTVPLPDLKDVKGQESAKRVLEIAAAGGHNLPMIGAPGSGKSMLAARLPSILPPLTPEEMLEVSMVHSLAGELMGGKLATRRPFRAPHHSASMAALVGGGSKPRPGEVSLAPRVLSSTSCRSSCPTCSTRCASRSRPARP
jgi:magnesium chelatase family protein